MHLKISKSVLDLIFECAKESHPKEFAALLKVENKIITELILLPGTLSGARSALFQLHMLPPGSNVIGTVHSHPSYNFRPSAEDLQFFAKFSGLHIIAAMPYTEESWCAYDASGNELKLEIVQ